MKRPCLDCGRLADRTRCLECRRRKNRLRGSAPSRGYDREYRRKRAALLEGNPSCHWCGAPATTADHVPPLSEGGNHDHMVPACHPCNSARLYRAR